MTQQSRAPSPVSAPAHVRALQDRARRTRWLAAMTADKVVHAELVGYADELDRQVDAGETAAAPTADPAPCTDQRDIR
jgi:hypothetical protein